MSSGSRLRKALASASAGMRAGRFEQNDLTQSVYTGIRPARGGQAHRVTKELSQLPLEHALDRTRPRLTPEAVIGRALVSQFQADRARHADEPTITIRARAR